MTLSSENGNQMNIASGYSIFLKTLTLGIQSVKPLKKNCSIRDKRNWRRRKLHAAKMLNLKYLEEKLLWWQKKEFYAKNLDNFCAESDFASFIFYRDDAWNQDLHVDAEN